MENNSDIGNGVNLPAFCGETDTNINQGLVSDPAATHDFLSLWEVGALSLACCVRSASQTAAKEIAAALIKREGLKQSAKHANTGEVPTEAWKSTFVLGKPPFDENGTANLYFVYDGSRYDELQQFCPAPAGCIAASETAESLSNEALLSALNLPGAARSLIDSGHCGLMVYFPPSPEESVTPLMAENRAEMDNRVCGQVGEIVAELLQAKQADGLSRRYIETLRSHLIRFAAAFQTDFNLITAPQIEAWLKEQDVGPRTQNNMLGSVVTLFRFARKRGNLPHGRPTKADGIVKAKDPGGRIGILRPAELALLLHQAPQRIGLFLALGAFTGMRSSEILRLNWKDVNFDRSLITVRSPERASTATVRWVPMQPNLIRWLAPHRKRKGAMFKTVRDAGRAIAFAKSCGVNWPNNALRHSYAAYRLAVTADAARVALEMGNSPQRLMTNYRELADEKEGQEWFGISPDQPPNIAALATS
jgi:integrase